MMYLNGIGGIFISKSQKKLNESAVQDAEMQRKLQSQLLNYMGNTKATASGDSSTDQKKYMLLAGVGLILVFTILTLT
jgi:Flp pilus assembly protein TadB